MAHNKHLRNLAAGSVSPLSVYVWSSLTAALVCPYWILISLFFLLDPKSFAREFCSGYLIGEVLHKYELQNDFEKFSQKQQGRSQLFSFSSIHFAVNNAITHLRTANSKLNNFTRVEPTLQLLSIPFDQNVAQNIMSEQHGAATRLLYQLYIALQKKKKAGLTGVALETLRAAAPAKLQSIGTEMYKERLKTLVPRQSDLSLQQVTKQFELRAKEMEERLARLQNDEMKKIQKIQEELRIQDIEKLRRARRRQNEIMARIQAAIVQIPKPPANRTLKAIEEQKILRKKKEAEEVYNELTKFEKSVKKDGLTNSVTLNGRGPTLQRLRSTASIGAAVVKLDCSEDYVKKIQKRVEEDAVSREQREKRRRRILMEQLVAHGAQEEAFREEQLINRLMRQSQQERRIAVQLMHCRHEKEVMRQNRILREKQYEERREREFQDALDREATMTGEWISSNTAAIKPAPNNNILGHVVHRLMNIVHPPPPPTAAPGFPPFPIKGCVLGNIFSGKSTCLKHLAQAYGVQVLNADDLVQESIKAYSEDEMDEKVQVPAMNTEEACENKITESFTTAPDGLETQSSASITAAKKTDNPSQPQTLTSPGEHVEPKERTVEYRERQCK
ncbi:unnamed protein product [Ranitomeya imitator]|uniref:Uncharacterized protein n=1 Tax=Ranitomeya imitator TaxID=111125 RepID=A0ABN9MJ99_9NEOB|nr:unnamed protein product [Ranitomeya imitator]